MKKYKWWLKQEISEIFWRAEIDDNLNIQGANLIFDKIDDAIDQLDEPEKPVIPQLVADYIEKWKEEGLTMYEWFAFGNNDVDEDVNEWLYNNTIEEVRRREHLLIDALRYGYEVEKEPQWVVRYEDGYFSEEIKFGCGIDGDWVDEVSRAYHFTDKAKAEAVALLIGGTVEEVTK